MKARDAAGVLAWLERVDPGSHRRIKGLRLVTAYGIAAMLGSMPGIHQHLTNGASLGVIAGGFALWASVSEARSSRPESSRDLILLCLAAAAGAVSMLMLAPLLGGTGSPRPELVLVSGAFLVGYLKRFGLTGGGIGSQIYIGQLLAYGAALIPADLAAVGVATALAIVGAVVPRVLSGPAEQPVLPQTPAVLPGRLSPELRMGLQAAIGALVIVALGQIFPLQQSVWAITACTYVVTGSMTGTVERVWRRLLGTAIGVPLGLAFLPIAEHYAVITWCAAALAMVIYAMSLPDRYDIACGAFAFALIITLAVAGEHAPAMLAARAWETLLGAALGLAAAVLVAPIRTAAPPG